MKQTGMSQCEAFATHTFGTVGVRAIACLFFIVALAGCATTTARASDPRDPFEPLNRVSYVVNDGIDRAVLRPAAKAYHRVAPNFVQTGVSNAFANAKYSVTLVNNALQGKFGDALNDTGRFVLNSTLGLCGIFDPASDVGLDINDEDFGQTLGKWGVAAGPYFVIPFFGPTTLRDGIGSIADDFTEPRSYLEDDSTRWTIWTAGNFEKRVRLVGADAVIDRAGDRYTFLRSAYLQRREYQVRDGNVPAENFEDVMLEPEDNDSLKP